MRPRPEPRLSIFGYAILNGVVIGLTLAIWFLAKSGFFGWLEPLASRAGLFSLLIWIPIGFLAVSIYDAFFDRHAARAEQDAQARLGRTPARGEKREAP